MRDHLVLFLNGKLLHIAGDEAFLTLAEFVRQRRGLTGTKVVCAEGDCGACAVLVGRPNAAGKLIRYTSVNSCIQMMFQLDACHVITIEGLSDGPALNPIQNSMVACHGAQCGFCTPGFVVSLCDLMEKSDAIDAHAVRRGLVGNLCRCTGYDSIIRAALSADRSNLKKIESLYPSCEMLEALAGADGKEVFIQTEELRFFKPTSLTGAAEFLRGNSGCAIVSGATDVGVQRNKGIRQIKTVVSLAGLRTLEAISKEPDAILVGACATLSDLERFTADVLGELSEYLAWFGSPLIKNSGTLAGNLANASPIGDMIPPLMVLNAKIELAGPASVRWVEINRFYTGYRATVLRPDEIITRVRIPLPAAGDVYKLYKVSKRKDLDISSFSAAIWMRQEEHTIREIRIAFGGVGPVVRRMTGAEQFLTGQALSEEVFQQAGRIARQEVTPISDVRGSEEYRRTLAENILMKFWHDLGEESAVAIGANGNGEGK